MRLRIDELAHRAGTTSRNVRAYQARGLLPPPQLEGRTGYYGEEHLRRLELIGELQDRGFSLEAIRHTLDAWAHGGDLAHLVGLRNVLAAPITDEQPLRLPLQELLERFPEAQTNALLLQRAVDLGLVVPDGDEYVAPSPLLFEAGEELSRAGVPLEAVLSLVAAIRPHIAAIAEEFVTLVSDQVALPGLERAESPEDLDRVLEVVHRLKPLALEVVRPFLAQELQGAIERAVQEQAAQQIQDEARKSSSAEAS
jgi:DNA-binding transcriptional MerR regulator